MDNHPKTYPFRLRDSLLGAQMLFVAFGALVLVPRLSATSGEPELQGPAAPH